MNIIPKRLFLKQDLEVYIDLTTHNNLIIVVSYTKYDIDGSMSTNSEIVATPKLEELTKYLIQAKAELDDICWWQAYRDNEQYEINITDR